MSEIKKLEKDQYLFREGDPANAMYMIKSGSFALIEARGYSERKLAEISSGEIIGELSLFDGRRHDIGLKALSDAEVVVMPYTGITKQIEQLPQWAQALMKTMIGHMHRLIQHARAHTNMAATEETSGYVLTKYVSILNLVSLKQQTFLFSTLRNYTIQIFQEPTAKMSTLIDNLVRIGFLSQEIKDDGEVEITNHKTQELVSFVDWYNAWLFRPETQRLPLLNTEEVRTLEGLLHFAQDAKPNAKGFSKINLTKIQEDSQAKLGYAIRIDDVSELVAKKYLPEPLMEDSGVMVVFDRHELTFLMDHCKIINALDGVMS